MNVVTNIWDYVNTVCGVHGSETEPKMILDSHNNTLSYVCSKCLEENLNPNEKKCKNKITIEDYENMLLHLSDLLVDAEINNTEINLKYHKWTKRNIKYEVIEHTPFKIVVKVVNKNLSKS